MPELPEVETVRRGLIPVLEGRRLIKVVVRRPDLRRPLPPGLSRRLEGRRVDRVDRRAKFLLIFLDGAEVLVAHLGMSGRMRIVPSTEAPPPGPHDHVVFETDGGDTIVFCDPRRFGLMDLVPVDGLEELPLFSGLGPEPLDDSFDGPALAARLAHRRGPLKTVLLDQKTVAGLGNIYVCEALFRAGLSPLRKAHTVTGRQAARLAAAIRDVLRDAIAAGGSSLRDHRRPDGEIGYFQHSFAVYGRAGEPCPGCNCAPSEGGIRRIVQSGRSTFYCAKRQR